LNEKDIRILCQRCHDDYKIAGYEVTSAGLQPYAQHCDKCGRPGYEYIVRDKGGGDRGTGMGTKVL